MPKKKLFIIDAHALCYRSFYAIRDLATSKGQATNAVWGFLNTLRKILRVYSPEYMAVCFDSPKKTYRQEKFAEYKIQRPKMPEALIEQIPIIKQVVQAHNLSIFEFGGFEADDIIATLTNQATKKNIDVVIVSEDKDMYQLVDDRVEFFSARKDMLLGYKEIKEKLGFEPGRVSDFIALAGDQSDNIPGVAGIGKVTARNLINDFGTLDDIYRHVDDIKSKSVKEKLENQKKQAYLSKELAILESKVPFNLDLHQLKVDSPDNNRLLELFKELEFRKLAQELMGSDDNSSKAKKVKCKIVDDKNSIKDIIDKIKSAGKFAFLVDAAEEDLFDSNALNGILISFGEKDVYEVPFDKLKDIKEIFKAKKITKITYDIKSALKLLKKVGLLSIMVPTFDNDKSIEATVMTVRNKEKQATIDEIANEYFVQENTFDVMLAGYLLSQSQNSKDINNLAWKYLKSSADGSDKKAKEVNIIYMLYPLMLKDLKESSLDGLLNDIEIPLAYILFGMEAHGVNIDEEHLKKLSVICDKKITALTSKIYEMAGEEFNLNSPKQLGNILFGKLKLPATKKTKTGYSTNEEVLTKLAKQHELPSFVLEYRQIAKLKSTYIDALPKLISGETRRLHACFNQAGTETGRLSSSNPNLQNIPVRTELGREIRRAIIPSSGDLLMMAADYSQIELRILAHLSQDENMLRAFNSDEDIHAYTASLIFDLKEKDVTPEMRNSAKRVNFGIIYGMSAFGLAKDLQISHPEAQEFIDTYFLRYPKVKEFMDNSIEDCEKKGYATTLLNRRRYIPEINSRNVTVKQFAQRQAINTPVQGSAADLMKLSMINVQKKISEEGLNSRMLITVHDELVFDLDKKEKKIMIGLVKKEMEHPLNLSVPIKVDIKIGSNWLDMEKI